MIYDIFQIVFKTHQANLVSGFRKDFPKFASAPLPISKPKIT
ncbi:MAG: hypothetical protein BAJALOKI3v1_90037 [Promethearchaeota archaeon]|nr:MAG: hypothetical protein BAJALOKI3v1_90037 [Candidatus Lokiarchaeota archaeon]